MDSGAPSAPLLLAIDVGSTSARAGVFDAAGHMLASASRVFDVHRPQSDYAEHDSNQIWAAVGMAVRHALATCGKPSADVVGVGFDATCSLVLLDAQGAPVTASITGEDRWNVIMWADHRAVAEATEITATGHQALEFVGNTMSPEMELPKLLWLRRYLPAAWARYGLAMDLADFLVWRATDVVHASACTVTCKWAYLNHPNQTPPGWQDELWTRLGLGDLRQHLRLPAQATPLGGRAGGLTEAVANDWGLRPGIAAGVGMIDAHAGALGVLGATSGQELDHHLALIAGTSNCHMALSPQARAVPGIWGPYFGALLPTWWLNEGGQSATGALLDHVLDSHVLSPTLGEDRHARMGDYLQQRRAEVGPGYASDVLVLPDFHGNRSPLARPDLRGVVHGLDMDSSMEGLARLYHATAVGIAYGTRHIIDALNTHGYRINQLHLTGGHAKSPLLVRLYADATGCAVHLPREADGVLLGTALLAATAAGVYPDFLAAGLAMVHTRERVVPSPAAFDIHACGYAAFRRMLEQREEVLALLHGVADGCPGAGTLH